MDSPIAYGLRVLVVGDVGDDDPGFVGARLRQHEATVQTLDRDRLPDYRPGRADLVLLLGSARSGAAPDQAGVVAQEAAFARDALDDGVPVLGICYGSQLLAHALGGAIHESPRPEVGISEIPTSDPVLCPPGPWVLMHSDSLTPPSTAASFGATPGGCVGFCDTSYGARALAWQYHPEVTPSRFAQWLDSMAEWVVEQGGDARSAREQALALEDDLRKRAYALTDSAVDWLLDR